MSTDAQLDEGKLRAILSNKFPISTKRNGILETNANKLESVVFSNHTKPFVLGTDDVAHEIDNDDDESGLRDNHSFTWATVCMYSHGESMRVAPNDIGNFSSHDLKSMRLRTVEVLALLCDAVGYKQETNGVLKRCDILHDNATELKTRKPSRKRICGCESCCNPFHRLENSEIEKHKQFKADLVTHAKWCHSREIPDQGRLPQQCDKRPSHFESMCSHKRKKVTAINEEHDEPSRSCTDALIVSSGRETHIGHTCGVTVYLSDRHGGSDCNTASNRVEIIASFRDNNPSAELDMDTPMPKVNDFVSLWLNPVAVSYGGQEHGGKVRVMNIQKTIAAAGGRNAILAFVKTQLGLA